MAQLYNHAFDFAFAIETPDETGGNLTAAVFRSAIKDALAKISDEDLISNIGMPFDSYDVDEE